MIFLLLRSDGAALHMRRLAADPSAGARPPSDNRLFSDSLQLPSRSSVAAVWFTSERGVFGFSSLTARYIRRRISWTLIADAIVLTNTRALWTVNDGRRLSAYERCPVRRLQRIIRRIQLRRSVQLDRSGDGWSAYHPPGHSRLEFYPDQPQTWCRQRDTRFQFIMGHFFLGGGKNPHSALQVPHKITPLSLTDFSCVTYRSIALKKLYQTPFQSDSIRPSVWLQFTKNMQMNIQTTCLIANFAVVCNQISIFYISFDSPANALSHRYSPIRTDRVFGCKFLGKLQ